jgi:hypothetical protein
VSGTDAPSQPSPYEVALAAITTSTAASIVGLLRQVPPSAWSPDVVRVLAQLIGLRVAAGNAQARSLAALYVQANLAQVRGQVPAVVMVWHDEVDRLTKAADTILTTGDVPPPSVSSESTPVHDALWLDHAEAAVDRAVEEAFAGLDAQDAADARQAETDLVDLHAEVARLDEQFRQDQADHLAALDREAAARPTPLPEVNTANADRLERMLAEREMRLERLARGETTQAAADAIPAAAAEESFGWVRQLNVGACPTCVAWWASGDGQFSPVRPWSIPMKRHPGCECTQRPIVYPEELHVRGFAHNPEPVADRYKRARDRADTPTDTAPGGNAP